MSPPRKIRRSAANTTPVSPSQLEQNESQVESAAEPLNESMEPQPSTSAATQKPESPQPSTSATVDEAIPSAQAAQESEATASTAADNQNNDNADDVNPMGQFEDEEGGFTVMDIYIPPPIKPYCSSESRGARLMITKIMNTNFKSYAQNVALGPFCHRFHAIIGPNGSGKSNVIDSMLFVFGYRSNKIRCKKLASMIHSSNKFPNVNSCRVAVHFAQIEDNEDGTYTTVKGSEFVIAREAHRNNSSFYTIDDRRVQFKEVAILLKKHDVDLDHNRFLILQGEVESIAMMKPKAQNENECGHLEYLEDIIGTTRYKEPLEKISARVDVLSEERTEKHNRCKMAERELNDLKAPMEEAVAYLKLENDLARTKNKEIQLNIYSVNKNLVECTAEMEENKKNLTEHDEKYKVVIADREAKEKVISEELANAARVHKRKEEHEVMKKNAQSKHDEIQSAMAETNKRRKQIGTQLKKKEAELEELKRVPVKNQKEIEECERKNERLTKDKEKQEQLLQQNTEKLETQVKPFSEKKAGLETQLATVQEKHDVAKAELNGIEQELKLVQQNEMTEKRKYQNFKESLEESQERLEARRKEYTEAEKLIPKIQNEIAQCETAINQSKAKEAELRTEVTALRATIQDKETLIRQARSNNKILDFLMRAKLKGDLPGVLGRLGDLGGINKKYDVAISTCCGRLDNIVVDSIDTAERCILALKQSNVGRATFIALEKIAHHANDMHPIQTCGGSLISRRHVVTAGHCVARATPRQVHVTLGDYVINSAVEPLPAYTFGVRKIDVHPYFKFTPQADRFDVSVLTLERPVHLMPHIAPICLPEKNEDFLGKFGWAAGWGALNPGSRLRSKTLQAVDVPVIENRICERWHRSNGINVVIYPEMLCAGYRGGGKDSCQGDSGGPLMHEKNGRWYLIGVVSAGYSCASRGQPGIYHRVPYTVDWISYVSNLNK